MAANRRKESSAVRFGPLLKVILLCLFFGGAALGYVWQKNQIAKIDRDIISARGELERLGQDNRRKADSIAALESHGALERRAAEMRLGLEPTRQGQIVHLPEPVPHAPAADDMTRGGQLAMRATGQARAY
jgi:hypothetical protein